MHVSGVARSSAILFQRPFCQSQRKGAPPITILTIGTGYIPRFVERSKIPPPSINDGSGAAPSKKLHILGVKEQFKLVLYLLVQPSLNSFHALAHFLDGVLLPRVSALLIWRPSTQHLFWHTLAKPNSRYSFNYKQLSLG